MSANRTFYNLLNESIAALHGGNESLSSLHSLLHAMLKHLDMRDMDMQWKETPHSSRQPYPTPFSGPGAAGQQHSDTQRCKDDMSQAHKLELQIGNVNLKNEIKALRRENEVMQTLIKDLRRENKSMKEDMRKELSHQTAKRLISDALTCRHTKTAEWEPKQCGTAASYNAKSVNLVQKQPDHSMTVPLNCGGSHTFIRPTQLHTSQQDRKHRVQTQVGIMTHPKQGDILRVEGKHFSLNTPARRYTETKCPPISTKVGMGKTEDKAKRSLSHEYPSQVDFLSFPPPLIISQITLQPNPIVKARTQRRQRGSIAVQDSKVTKG